MTRSIDNPTQLADLVQYQEGSVVSQTLLQEGSCTVTVFAFDAGEGLNEHTAPYDVLLYLLEGRTTVTVSGVDHALITGQLMRLPANAPHALRSGERFKMMLIMVRPA